MVDFVIIGAQKCGSSYIHNVIREHPEVYSPGEEIPFLEDPDFHNNGLEKIAACFRGISPKLKWGVKRPNYLAKEEVPKRIYNHLDQPKLIAILRNPIERFISAYYHYINTGFIPPVEINKGIKKISGRKWKNKYPRAIELFEFGLYHKGLKRYFELFNSNDILILLYDDLITDKLKVIKRGYRFLDIEKNFIPNKNLNKKPQKVIYSINRLKLLKIKNRFQYNYSKDRMRYFKKENLNKKDKIALKTINTLDNILFRYTKSHTKPALEPDTYKLLKNYYRADIEKLSKLIGKNLNYWIDEY